MAEGVVTIEVHRTNGGIEYIGPVGEAFVETKDLDLGSRFDKHVAGILLEIEGAERINDGTIQVGTCSRRGEAVIWHAGRQNLSETHEMFWFDLPDTRFFRLLIREGVRSSRWKLSRIEFYGRSLKGML